MDQLSLQVQTEEREKVSFLNFQQLVVPLLYSRDRQKEVLTHNTYSCTCGKDVGKTLQFSLSFFPRKFHVKKTGTELTLKSLLSSLVAFLCGKRTRLVSGSHECHMTYH